MDGANICHNDLRSCETVKPGLHPTQACESAFGGEILYRRLWMKGWGRNLRKSVPNWSEAWLASLPPRRLDHPDTRHLKHTSSGGRYRPGRRKQSRRTGGNKCVPHFYSASVSSTGVHRRSLRHRGNLRKGKELLPVSTELIVDPAPEGSSIASIHGLDQCSGCGDAKQHSSLHHALGAQPLARRHIVTARQVGKHASANAVPVQSPARASITTPFQNESLTPAKHPHLRCEYAWQNKTVKVCLG